MGLKKDKPVEVVKKDKMLDEKIHDPYMVKGMYSDPTICPTCGLVFHNKTWKKDPKLLEKVKKEKDVEYKDCPACRKIKDNYPLGLLIIQGEVLNNPEKVREVMSLVKHEEEKEQVSNPLARVMKIENLEDRIEISTTTEGLATRLGKALNKAHQGNLEFIFSDNDKFLRVIWKKD
ncbi:MAG: BCAM0308 family protein [candidate division WOR-3 bacterium]